MRFLGENNKVCMLGIIRGGVTVYCLLAHVRGNGNQVRMIYAVSVSGVSIQDGKHIAD